MADVFHFADGKGDGMATEGVEITRFNQVILTSIAHTFFWSIERFIFSRRKRPLFCVTIRDNNFLLPVFCVYQYARIIYQFYEIYLLNIPCF
jgi:hypothetical protein